MASRLTGSEDLYGLSLRRPWASVNFVTAHDGFTLRDLVSYERKHNEANGEDNRDGTDDNRSQNFGVEGETTSPVVRARRLGRGAGAARDAAAVDGDADAAGRRRAVAHAGRQQQRLLPDDDTSWVDWSCGVEAEQLTAFVARLTGIRRSSTTLHRDRFYRDGDVTWWHFSGRPMGVGDWHEHGTRSLGLLVGEWLILLHAGDAAPCTLPPGGPFTTMIDSTRDDGTPASTRSLPGGTTITIPTGALLLLRRDVPPAP